MTRYIPRYLEDVILRAINSFKVLYLSGPRQVGKTTLLKKIAAKRNINYVTLDSLNDRQLAKKDPELFLQRYSAPVLIDEVQYAPELFPYIKINVDRSEQNGLYWLTGSQQFSLIKNIQESLAGRVAILNLLGLSLAELHHSKKNQLPFLPGIASRNLYYTYNGFFSRIHRGSFPATATDIEYTEFSETDDGRNKISEVTESPDLNLFYNSYIQTYIDRDISGIFGIEKLSEFHKFLQLCAARTGQILNYSNLARDADVSVHAAKEWISMLESTMQIMLLRPYYSNISKRLIKAPKLYFLDTGLAAHLSNWQTPGALGSSAVAGAFFETFVISEIYKSYLYRGLKPSLYYFREKEGHEVDLLIEVNQKIYPVEIKLAGNIHETDFKNIAYLQEKLKNIDRAGIISMSENYLPLNRFCDIIPASMIS